MTGKILGFDAQNNNWIISGDDGNRYEFGVAEWKSEKANKIGQKVDFQANGNSAKNVYPDASSTNIGVDEIKATLINIKDSEVVSNVQNNLNNAIKSGVQNKYGFFLAILTALAMFLPTFGYFNAFDANYGTFDFMLLLLLASFYYIGIKHIFVKVLTVIIAIFAFFQFYDLFSMRDILGNKLFFGSFRIGIYALVPLIILLTLSGFKKNYNEKNKF